MVIIFDVPIFDYLINCPWQHGFVLHLILETFNMVTELQVLTPETKRFPVSEGERSILITSPA